MSYYQDSETGVRSMLEECADDHIKPVTFRADPLVAGCWIVTCEDGCQLIAYVADHPFAGDFEEIA